MGPAFRIGSFWVVILKPLIEIVLGLGPEAGNCVGAGLPAAETALLAESPFGAIFASGDNVRIGAEASPGDSRSVKKDRVVLKSTGVFSDGVE